MVKEILPEQIKDVNPLDIIYLAMKDGSIILISDRDEEKYDILDKNLNTDERKTNDILLSDKIEKTNLSKSNYSSKKPSEPFGRKKIFIPSDKNKDLNYTFNYENQSYNTNLTKTESNKNFNLSQRCYSQDHNKTITFEYKINQNNSKYTLSNNPFKKNERSFSQKPKIGDDNQNYMGNNKYYYQIRGGYYKKENNNNYSNTSRRNVSQTNKKVRNENLNLTYSNNNSLNYKNYYDQKVTNITQPIDLDEYYEDSLDKKTIKTEPINKNYNENEIHYYRVFNNGQNKAKCRSQSFDRQNIVCVNNDMGVHKILNPKCPKCRDKAREMNLDLISVGDEVFYDNHSYFQTYDVNKEDRKYVHTRKNKENRYYYQ